MHAVKRGLLIFAVILVLGGGAAALVMLRSSGTNVDPPPRPDAALVIDEEVRQSIDAAHQAASSNPGDAPARATLAMVYDAARMHSLAEATYEQAIALDGDNAELWYHLARSREAQGNVTGALEAIDRAAALAPQQFIIHVRKGMWLLDRGEPAKAEAAFRSALERKQDSLAARLGLARALVSQEKYADAVPVLEQLRSALPADGTIRQLLGRCYVNTNRPNDGAAEMALGVGSKWDWTLEDAWLDNVLKLRTGYRARFERAMAFLEGGAPARAVSALEELRSTYPDDVPVALGLCAAYEATGQIDRGLDVLHQADVRNADHFAVKLNIGHFYHVKSDLPRAMRYTNEAIALNPTLAAGHVQKARMLLMQNQVDAAMASADEAIKCDASNVDARFLKAQALLAKRQFAEAVTVLEQATRSHPHVAHGFALLAAARYNAGRTAEAVAALAQAERLDPNNPTVVSIRQQLRGAR